jgi:S-DNA-T family DNA segregation ATPase FtsK/SpoIIIE
VPLGLTDLDLDVFEVDLSRRHVAVCGPPQSGRSTALSTIAAGLGPSPASHLHLAGVGAASSPLARLPVWDTAGFGRVGQVDVLEDLLERFDVPGAVAPLAVVFVDTVEDLDAGAGPLLDRLVRAEAVRLVVAAGTSTIGRGHSGWLGELRRSRTLLMLQPEHRTEVDQVAGVRPRFRPGQAFPPGRGVLVAPRSCELVQVAVPTWKQINRHESVEKLRLV